MASTHAPTPAALDRLLAEAAARAQSAGVFADVAVRGGELICRARASAAPASYRLGWDDGRLWVSLVMADRWLSESIEADLMHTGDRIEDLLEEELADQNARDTGLTVEHFRSEDMLFTFRSALGMGSPDLAGAEAADRATRVLLAYEACFRRLGDMAAEEENG